MRLPGTTPLNYRTLRSEGIAVVGTKGTMLSNNSVVGSDEFDAIGIHDSTLATVINNAARAGEPSRGRK
jgi:hypothetical protein